jgi:alpha/beta superfamily hydrolase
MTGPQRSNHWYRRVRRWALGASGMVGLAIACLVLAPRTWAQEHVDLSGRAGVTETIYVTAAKTPFASAILFPGGTGVVRYVRNNFLIRVAGDFADSGITVAVADAPSDHAGGMNDAFRASDAQAADTAAIIAYLQSRAALPMWLIGTSNGTISAANAAVRLGPPRVAGVVLTSSVWAGGLADVPFATLRVPVLLVHNRNDGCRLSPFDRAAPALASMTAAPARQLIVVESTSLLGSPCEARSPHGYFQIEGQVVRSIVAWIRTH